MKDELRIWTSCEKIRLLRIPFMTAFLVALPSLALGDALKSEAAAEARGTSKEFVEIPIEHQMGLILISGELEGLDRPVRLALDTGSGTVVREELAASVAFRRDDTAARGSGIDAHGTRFEISPIVVPALRFSGMTFDRVPAISLRSDIFDRSCPPFDGLLGSRGPSRLRGVLERAAVEIDYDSDVVRLYGDLVTRPSGDTVLPLRDYFISQTGEKRNTSQWWVPVAIGRKLIWSTLDSGSAVLPTMSLSYFKSLGRSVHEDGVLEDLGPPSIGLRGSGGIRASWVTLVRNVKLGSIDLGDVPFRIVDNVEDGPSEVVLSQHILSRFNVLLDYQRGELVLTGRKNLPDVRVFRTEMAVEKGKGGLVVAGLLKGGAAERAGLRMGDRVVRANGESLTAGDSEAMCTLRRQMSEAREPLKVSIVRWNGDVEVLLPPTERLEASQ